MIKVAKRQNCEEELTIVIKNIRNELDTIHNELFGDKTLDVHTLEELLKKVLDLNKECLQADDKLLDLFIKYREKYEKYKDNYKFALGLCVGFGIAMFFRPLSSLMFGLSLLLVNHMKKAIARYDDFVARDDVREEFYQEIQMRARNYIDVLKVKLKRSQVEELLESREAKDLEIVNEWLKLVIDEAVELDCIPMDIKRKMLEVLQFELQNDSQNLRELIEVVRDNFRQNIVERGLYLKKG